MVPGVPVIDCDEHLWVLNKPAGLLSAPGRGPLKQDCLWARVQGVDPQALGVHRLDQPTSGLMLMARSLAVQRTLHAAFAQRQVRKLYLAVVDGLLMPFIGVLIPGGDWRAYKTPGPVAFELGRVAGAAIDFVIVAFVVFWIAKKIMKEETVAKR